MSYCICSKHGFHSPTPVGPGRIWDNNWKPCLEDVLRSVHQQVLKVLSLGFG